MTAHPKDGALVSPVQPAPPSERPPGLSEGNASPSSPAHLRGGGEAQTPATRAEREPPRVAGQSVPGMAKLAAAMSEADLERKVRAIAGDLGLLAYHTHDSRRSPEGYPDWTFCGPRGVMWRELKRENGRLTAAQWQWLTALVGAGQDACVWRPSDLIAGTVARELAALAGIGAR